MSSTTPVLHRLGTPHAPSDTRLTASSSSKPRGIPVAESTQVVDQLVQSSTPRTSLPAVTMLPSSGEPAATPSSSQQTATLPPPPNGTPPAGAPPTGTLTANADGSITTPGGYTIFNDGGHQWRIREPSGVEHRIWGDPHVDENNDGTLDWNFNTDAMFVLPDGTSIFCDTDKVGELAGKDVTTSTSLHIAFGQSLATMDVVNGGAAQLSTASGPPPKPTDPVSTYVLADGSHFVDAKTLGTLSNTDGDDAADVSTTSFGTISAQAQAVLQIMASGGQPPQP